MYHVYNSHSPNYIGREMKAVKCILLVLVLCVLSVFHVNVAGTQEPYATFSSADLSQTALPNKDKAPIIYHPDKIDKDFDRVADDLESMLSNSNPDGLLSVVVTLYNPVTNFDLARFTDLGGNITYIYRYVTYGFAGWIQAGNLPHFVRAEGNNLVIVERDAPVELHLDLSVPLTRVRQLVWNSYGYRGSENNAIAIIDTGIDDSHPDLGPYGSLNFSRKIIGWHDATPDGATMPQDFGEHGSHVAGIAAGTGAANALQGAGVIGISFTGTLPSKPHGPWVYGYVDYIDVLNLGVINLNCSWNGTNTVLLVLSNPAGNEVERTSGTAQPLILTYDTTGTSYPTGRYGVFVGNAAGSSGTPFSCKETYPYQGLNDGYNLFTGMAPDSRLVGVKVFDNKGSGTSSTVMAGLDWVIANRLAYHIVVASMSLGLEGGAVDTTLDQKVDTLVKNGIVMVVSAGNDYLLGNSIGSPGTAAYAITVAATNDQNGITDYSSNGDTAKNEYGLIKPDVAAPGGTFQPAFGNKILSVDSNDADGNYTTVDRVANDYQQMAGTSMSAPHVSGTAALVAQALVGWSWTEAEALKVKMLIGMTAFETQSGESGNIPSLNRGEKDSKEGYGRICADAAVEAAAMVYQVRTSVSDVFGSNPSDKKVWARRVSLSGGCEYEFSLTVPSGADYDLYLYSGNPDVYGQPVIAAKSVNFTQGTMEAIRYTPVSSGSYYIVAKWVGGNGQFTLQSTVGILGDANGDAAVNATDLLLVDQAFGSVPGSSNWNVNCDFNKDNIVNVSDLKTLGKNYGKAG